jgi:hypothetical protein
MWKWLGVLLGLVFLASSQAYGATCTFKIGVSTWGDITTVAGEGTDCGAVPASGITGADVVVIPLGASVTIVDDIVFTTPAADNGILVEAGGTFIWDQTNNEATITFTDGTTCGVVADVAFCAESGSIIRINGGFNQWGEDVTPRPQRTHTEDNYTTWTVDQIGVCTGVGAGASSIGTCSGSDANIMCLHLTETRNDPEDGLTGQNWLEEAVGWLDADYDRVRFTNGGERGWVYDVDSIDAVADDYEICIDISRAYDTASVDFPYADRAIVSGSVTAAGCFKGSTCTNVVGTTLAADGEYVGRCIRYCDTTGNNCDPRPYRITKTTDGVTCAGGAGNDAIYLSDINPLTRDLLPNADFTIDYCISSGDNFTVERPAWFKDGTPGIDTDGKILIASTDVTMYGVKFTGPATVKFDEAVFTSVGYIDVADAGDAGLGIPALEFEDMTTVEIDWISGSGGDGTGGSADWMELDGVGVVQFTNLNVRYWGQYAISTIGSDNGNFDLRGGKFEYIGDDAASGVGIHADETNYWDYAEARDLYCGDCINGLIGDFIRSDVNPAWVPPTNHEFHVDGVLALTTEGSFAKGAAHGTAGVIWKNVMLRNTIGGRGTSYPHLPGRLSHCDIRGPIWNRRAWTGYPVTKINQYLTDCIISDAHVSGTIQELIRVYDDATVSNVIVHNPSAESVTAHAPIKVVTSGGAPAPPLVLEYATVSWDEGVTTTFHQGVVLNNDNGSHLTFGSILVSGLSANDAVNSYGIYADTANLLDANTTFHSQFCVDRGRNAGAGTWTSVEPIASFPNIPMIGFVPRFTDPERNGVSLLRDDYISQNHCGAKVDSRKPGIQENRWRYMAEVWMVDKPYEVVRESKAYGP